MSTHHLAGSRIREKRLDRGLRQAAVAETVGISPSYLNLIEHNRRRIGGKLLADIARVLKVDAALLTDGADAELLGEMRNAAGQFDAQVEVAKAEEIAARYPGWSALVAAQSRRIAELELLVQTLRDRMAHDPALAASLHEVISSVSAIRSASAILIGPEALDEDWQNRFHKNIHNDSLRLAASSEALIGYLEVPDTQTKTPKLPVEQLENWLMEIDFYIAGLEGRSPNLDAVVAGSKLTGASAEMLRGYATRYAKDAAALPFAAFETACRRQNYDPAALVEEFNVPFAQVLRRMACLPVGNGHPPMALVTCDASGTITFSKSVPGFALPRSGSLCPLWPMFSALSRPAQAMRSEIILSGATPIRALCYAIATSQEVAAFDQPPVVQSTMLVMPDAAQITNTPQPVGISCRMCPLEDCTSRREPAIAGVTSQSVL